MDADLVYLNAGIYSVAEAAQLTQVSVARIRRWLRGYKSTTRGRSYGPLWRGQFEPIDNRVALGFLDLMEIKFVGAFRELGVTWPIIHKAREKAAEWFPDESHPFCTRRFLTDGKKLLLELHNETNEPSLIEIVESQQVFSDILRPYLKGLEFNSNNVLERWWPLGEDRPIAIDPKRNFGQPTIFERGIPTRVLAKSVKANRSSIDTVAKWYGVEPSLVKEAVEYELRLAA